MQNNPTETYTIEVTQFLRPNGRKNLITAEFPIETQPLYESMTKAGCRLEAEVLMTDEVSFSISNEEKAFDVFGLTMI